MNNKTKNTLRLAPSVATAIFIAMSAAAKLTGLPVLVHHFRGLELERYLPMFGSMELTFAILFLHPRTTKIGFCLLTTYFGGAIATELRFGPAILAPAIFLLTIWVAAYIRNPAIFTSQIIRQEKGAYSSQLSS